jgi:uncharacterized membrane protein YjjP (DUF1212 family)
MGAFIGACILAMAVGYFEPRLGDEAAIIGGVVGLIGGLWLTLRRDGQLAGSVVVGLTIVAFILIGCLGYVAFSQ